MHQAPPNSAVLLAVVPAALLATSLVGCGLAEDAVKDAAEDAAKSEGVDLDPDNIEDGDIDIESTDGSITTGKLPKDFPTDEVPSWTARSSSGSYTKNPETWNATIQVGPAGGDKQAAYDDAAATLGLDAGARAGRQRRPGINRHTTSRRRTS